MVICYILVALILAGFWWSTRDSKIIKVQKGQVFEFKTYYELLGLPIACFYQGNKKYFFIIDTGCNITNIDSNSDIITSNAFGSGTVVDAGGNEARAKVVNIKLYYNKKEYLCEEARMVDMSGLVKQIEDASKVHITGLLGGDFFNKYNYCIDYKEYSVYSRK